MISRWRANPEIAIELVLVLGSILVGWGAFAERIHALEQAVAPVPQLQVDMATVKQAVLDIDQRLKDLAEERK